MSQFHELSVVEVRRETPNAVSVSLRVPDALRDTFDFTPGQYLTLRAEVDGEDIRRPYSICAGLDDGVLRVGIKRVPDGRFSTFACERLSPGDTLQVMPPIGRFTWIAPEEAEGLHHVGFASGSGVTPVLSIAKSILSRRPKDQFTLLYGNKATNEIMFLEELSDLKDQHLERLEVVHLLSREQVDVELLGGRLDAERVQALGQAGFFDPARVDAAYICGPGTMIDEVAKGLAALGVPEERVRFERFSAAPDAKPKVVARNTETGRGVEAILDGTHRSFTVAAEEDVISAASRQHIDLPYSCTGGMCCTCRCKVVEGEVDMAVNYSLEPWEVEAGFVLACQSRPKTERVVLDFDAQ